jgi:hypothetical protein
MMFFSERNLIRHTLEKKARMNKVRDLFKAREAVKQYVRDLINVRYTCVICGLSDYSCDHCGNCEAHYYDSEFNYCPDCGGYLSD